MGLYTIICPNRDCQNKNVFDAEEIPCPDCGTLSRNVFSSLKWEVFKDKDKLIEEMRKKSRKKATIKKDLEQTPQFLFSDDMPTSELKRRNRIDMENLRRHTKRVGSILGELTDLFAGSTSDPTLRAGFNALIYQNAIIIRQNELILRALTGVSDAVEESEEESKAEMNFNSGLPCPGCKKLVPESYDICPFCDRRLKI